jgi:hypothetical protein
MTIDPTRPSRVTRWGRDLLLVWWRRRQGREGRVAGSTVVCWWSKQGMQQWMRQLLLWRTHPWPHQHGVGPGIIEGGPHRGAPFVVARAVRAIVLAFLLSLTLPLPLPLLLGVGAGGRGATRGHSGSCCGGMEVAAAAEDTFLLRVWSRTRRPVPRPLSYPVRSI